MAYKFSLEKFTKFVDFSQIKKFFGFRSLFKIR